MMAGRPVLVLFAVLLCVVSTNTQANPRVNYLLHCSGCHGTDGASAPPNVPTLRGEIGRIVALPEGRDYVVRVPGAAHSPLSDRELAGVINWILREFNAGTLPEDFQPLSEEEVGEARDRVLMDPLEYRAMFYQPYAPGEGPS